LNTWHGPLLGVRADGPYVASGHPRITTRKPIGSDLVDQRFIRVRHHPREILDDIPLPRLGTALRVNDCSGYYENRQGGQYVLLSHDILLSTYNQSKWPVSTTTS
jgi:hypothetical protein